MAARKKVRKRSLGRHTIMTQLVSTNRPQGGGRQPGYSRKERMMQVAAAYGFDMADRAMNTKRPANSPGGTLNKGGSILKHWMGKTVMFRERCNQVPISCY